MNNKNEENRQTADRILFDIENKIRNEDEELLNELLSSFDQSIKVNVPSKEQFTEVISNYEKQARQKFIKELTLFIFIACIILTAFVTVLIELPYIFIIIQLFLFVLLPLLSRLECSSESEELFKWN